MASAIDIMVVHWRLWQWINKTGWGAKTITSLSNQAGAVFYSSEIPIISHATAPAVTALEKKIEALIYYGGRDPRRAIISKYINK